MDQELIKGKIYTAKVAQVFNYGIRVKIAGTTIYETLKRKEYSQSLINSPPFPENRIKVKVYDTFTVEGNVQYRISARLAEYDPWDPREGERSLESFLGIDRVRNKIFEMEITETTGNYAAGEIRNAVTARISLEAYAGYFKEKKLKSRMSFTPMTGDKVWGAVRGINRQERWVEIDPAPFMKDRLWRNKEPEGRELIQPVSLKEKKNIPKAAAIDNILIVEDDSQLCETYKSFLAEGGYRVFTATTEEAVPRALDILRREAIDFILLDMQVPEQKDSFGLLKELNQKYRKIKTVLISAADNFPFNINFDPVKEVNILGFLSKPFSGDALRELLYRLEDSKPQTIKDHLGTPGEESHGEEKADLRRKTEEILRELQKNTRVEALGLFEIHATSLEIRLPAALGINREKFEEKKSLLIKSPVKDCAMEEERIFTNSADSEDRKKHVYLRNIFDYPYNSCIGIPISTEEDWKLALFLFDDRVLTELERWKGEAAALNIALHYQDYHHHLSALQDNQEVHAGITYSILGHELKTKVNTLESTLALMALILKKQEAPDIAALQEKLLLSQAQTREINDMIAIYRRNTAVAHKQSCNLGLIVSEAARDAGLYARNNNIICSIKEITPPQSLPPVTGVWRELVQIFVNLFLNAIQQVQLFWPGEKVLLTVGFYLLPLEEGKPREIAIDITDNGPGIHRSDFETVFRKRYTLRDEGAGLGLFLCRRSLHKEGGNIAVQKSLLFGGTTFRVTIPVKEQKNE